MLIRFLTCVVVLSVGALLAGCDPSGIEPAEPTVEPAPEPEPAMPAEVLTAIVNQNANVRTGPGTGHAVAYWLTAGAEVTVADRNEEGTWLRIEHEDRPGWIAAALVDVDAGAAHAAATDAEMALAEPEPAPEAAEPTVAPDPDPTVAVEPEPAAAVHAHVHATVTGTVVNLRVGPGTEHATAGQVREGDELHPTGRNADGSWLQIEDPNDPARRVWIYGPLTDIDATSVQTLADATAVAIGVAAAPEPEPVAAAPAVPAAPIVPANCARRHTVNPNETRLQQITDWFGLDLAATAALNGIAPDMPLTAGMELCLPDAAAPQAQPVPAPQAAAPQRAAGGTCMTAIGPQPCIKVPDFPERGHPNAPVGQKVVDSPFDILWHAPGTYSRDLPGLDYDFELVFADNSAMWDWTVRDPQGCYDALRVHMGVVPKEVGLQRMELRLSDSFVLEEDEDGFRAVNWQEFLFRENDTFFSPYAAVNAPWLEFPWEPQAMPHPDMAVADYGCHRQPDGQALCDIMPYWGNSHSIHLNAVVAQAMANTVMYMSSNALANRYRSRLHDRVLQADAYLFPLLDNNRGEPAGHGPCADVWHAG